MQVMGATAGCEAEGDQLTDGHISHNIQLPLICRSHDLYELISHQCHIMVGCNVAVLSAKYPKIVQAAMYTIDLLHGASMGVCNSSPLNGEGIASCLHQYPECNA